MKLIGFYRMLPTYPAPLQLLFADDVGGRRYLQVVDRDKKIHSFNEAATIEEGRITLPGAHHLDAIVGDLATFAVALSKDHVLMGQTGSLQASLRHYIETNRRDIRPFDLLEFAMFVNDSALITEAARACKAHLETVAPSLVSRWIDGAPISVEVRARLLTTPEKDGQRPDRTSKHTRIGFTAPYVLMRALTTYAEAVGTTRASIVRSMFEDYDIAAIIDGLIPHVDRTLDLASSIIRSRAANKTTSYYFESRGAVWSNIKDIDGYRSARRSLLRSIYDSGHYSSYRHLPHVSTGQESVNYIVIATYYIRRYPSFEDYMRRLID